MTGRIPAALARAIAGGIDWTPTCREGEEKEQVIVQQVVESWQWHERATASSVSGADLAEQLADRLYARGIAPQATYHGLRKILAELAEMGYRVVSDAPASRPVLREVDGHPEPAEYVAPDGDGDLALWRRNDGWPRHPIHCGDAWSMRPADTIYLTQDELSRIGRELFERATAGVPEWVRADDKDGAA